MQPVKQTSLERNNQTTQASIPAQSLSASWLQIPLEIFNKLSDFISPHRFVRPFKGSTLEHVPHELVTHIIQFIPLNERAPLREVNRWLSMNIKEKNSLAVALAAAKHGSTTLIEWTFRRSMSLYMARFMENNHKMSLAAAEGGHLHVLRWLKHNGFEINKTIDVLAAANGHLQVVKWAHNTERQVSYLAIMSAGEKRHFDILKWAFSGQEVLCTEMKHEICERAAEKGELNLVRWALENQVPLRIHRLASIAKKNPALLELLHEHDLVQKA